MAITATIMWLTALAVFFCGAVQTYVIFLSAQSIKKRLDQIEALILNRDVNDQREKGEAVDDC